MSPCSALPMVSPICARKLLSFENLLAQRFDQGLEDVRYTEAIEPDTKRFEVSLHFRRGSLTYYLGPNIPDAERRVHGRQERHDILLDIFLACPCGPVSTTKELEESYDNLAKLVGCPQSGISYEAEQSLFRVLDSEHCGIDIDIIMWIIVDGITGEVTISDIEVKAITEHCIRRAQHAVFEHAQV